MTYNPTDQDRMVAKMMAASGIPRTEIAKCLNDGKGVTEKTMMKYLKDEVNQAATQANAKVAGTLYNQAINGNTTAAIFWLKTRAGWSERQAHSHSGKLEIGWAGED